MRGREIDMDKLITSSEKTLQWLDEIKHMLEKKDFCFREGKYWSNFISIDENKSVCQVQPQKNQIRILLKVEPSHNKKTELTPCTGHWAEYFPSVFTVKDKKDLEKAVELIIDSLKIVRK